MRNFFYRVENSECDGEMETEERLMCLLAQVRNGWLDLIYSVGEMRMGGSDCCVRVLEASASAPSWP